MSAQPIPREDWSTASDLPVQQNQDRDHFIFCPIDHSAGTIVGGGIDLSGSTQYLGFSFLPRSVFHRVRNKTYTDLRGVTGDAGVPQPGATTVNAKGQTRILMTVGKVQHTNFAMDIAHRLEHNYKDFGVTVLGVLTGVPLPVARWFQDLLVPANTHQSIQLLRDHLAAFDPQSIPTLPQSPEWVRWQLDSRHRSPQDIAANLQTALINSCNLGFAWLQTFAEEYFKEMRQASTPGKMGLSVITDKVRFICRELGIDIPVGLEQNVLAARAAAHATQSVQQGLAQVQFPAEFMDFMKTAIQQGVVRPVVEQPAIVADTVPPVAARGRKPPTPEATANRRAAIARAQAARKAKQSDRQ